MSQALIVSYDLVNPGQNYESLIRMIKSYPSWAPLGGSTYLISTHESPDRVRDALLKVLDRNDKIYVGVASAPAAWYGLTDEVSRWIHANQK
jgi:hypothetical protein